jgi:excisionase family DNA binding protein
MDSKTRFAPPELHPLSGARLPVLKDSAQPASPPGRPERQRFLTAAEAAAELRISPHTLRKLIRSQALPAHHVGGLLRISRMDLEDYLEQARIAEKQTPLERYLMAR